LKLNPFITKCVLAMVTVMLAVVSCSSSRPATTSPTEPTKVTAGYVPILIYAPFYIAKDKGYFQEASLDVTLEPLAGGADMLIQTAAGNFDVGAGGIGAAVFNAVAGGTQVRIVAPLHAERPPMTTALVTSKKAYDSGQITKISDLKGKKVAINARGAATEFWLDAALKKGGLTINDIDLIALAFPDIPAALDNGAIAGAMLAEPLTTLSEQKGIVKVLSDDFLNNVQPTAVYFNPRFAAEKRAAGEAFLVAYLRAARDLNGDGWKKPENLAIINKYTRVPNEIIAAARAPYHDPNGTVNITDLQKQQEFFAAQKQLTYTKMLDISSFVDTSFAKKAVQILGKP